MKKGSVFVLPMSDLERFAAHQRSVTEIGSTRPLGLQRVAGELKPPQAGATEPLPVTPQSTEFQLLGTGIYLKSQLSVVELFNMPREKVPAPKSVLFAGSAIATAYVLHHPSYKKSATEFKEAGIYLDPSGKSAEGAFKPVLEGRRRELKVEFVDELVSLAGGPCHVYSTPPAEKSAAEESFHWSEMYAVIEGDIKDVWISVFYPGEAAGELYAPLRAMLMGLQQK
jgi:hypothetical protein